jgi:hypothetical protein
MRRERRTRLAQPKRTERVMLRLWLGRTEREKQPVWLTRMEPLTRLEQPSLPVRRLRLVPRSRQVLARTRLRFLQ